MCCIADADTDADTEYWLFALHSIFPLISRSLALFLQYNTHNYQHIHYNLYQYKLPHIRLEQ